MFLCKQICDVAGENRPTGTYFIIEFDLTKVWAKFSYDIIVIIGQALFIDTQAVMKLTGFPEI